MPSSSQSIEGIKVNKEEAFNIEISGNGTVMILNIDSYTRYWTEYLSEKSLTKIEEENPWLFDRFIYENGLFFVQKFLTYHIPDDLLEKYPEFGTPYLIDNSWRGYANNLLYKYLIQEIFHSIETVNGFGLLESLITKKGLNLNCNSYAGTDMESIDCLRIYFDHSAYPFGNAGKRDAINIKVVDAIATLKTEAQAFIDRVDFVEDNAENFKRLKDEIMKKHPVTKEPHL
jgi:hypothetical protein